MKLQYIGSHIPNFKNSKMISRGRLITDPRKQKIMAEMIRKFQTWPNVGDGTFAINAVFFVSDKRKRDLDGMICTVMDCLVRGNVINDDNIYVISLITSRVEFVKRGTEGVEIEIIKNKSARFPVYA